MVPPPLPVSMPPTVHASPQNTKQVTTRRPPNDKICKREANEFFRLYNDDPMKAKYWLVNV